MNTTINRQQWQEEEALRRFQLISPLLQTGLDDAKRIQLRKKIAEENNISVRSLYRYEKAFSERQFTGLKPADREKHRSQKLPENFLFLLEQAIQLRKEVPERSVAQIIYILETEGLAVPGTLKRSTLERHIRPKDYIFKGKDGGAYRGTTFRQEFQQYCDKNGIADGSYIFKTHDYRHTLATQFYDEDVSIQTIRDYLGHFSEEMTKQYVDFMPKRIEKASDTYFKKPENDLASTIKAKKRGERK